MINLPFAVVDFETGGLDPKLHDPVQVAIQVLDSQTLQPLGSFMTYIRPDPSRVTEAALKVNNLTLEQLSSAPSPEEALMALEEFLRPYGKCLFVAHNAKFDYDFLTHWVSSHGNGNVKVGNLFDYRTICTAQMSFQKFVLDMGVLNSVKLTEISKYLGISHNAHDALGDVLVTAQVLRSCLQKSLVFKVLRGFKMALAEKDPSSFVRSLKKFY